jgi:large subunit ribosomal protein L25
VRCLPLAIPDSIPVDVTGIKDFDTSVTVADAQIPEGVELLTDPASVVASVVPPRLRLDREEGEEAEEAAAAEEAAE